MFYSIARFELRYQLRNPVFWAAAILFFLLTFAGTSVQTIRLGAGGNIHSNAPTAIAQIQLTMSLFFMLVTTAFVGNVVVRDDETGFGSIIRSTKIGKFPYMLGRFSGAFLGAAVAFLVVPLAIWIGTFMPWVDPEHLGPNRFQDYLFGYGVFALPNLLITSAIFFAVACSTRSVTYSYLTVILFMVAYFTLTTMLRKWPDLTMAAYLEPFGSVAYGLGVRYLTPAQANMQALELTEFLVGNRLLWLALSAAIVAAAILRFRFAERGASPRKAKRQAKRAQKLASAPPVLVDRLASGTPSRAAWHQLRTRAALEMKLGFKSPAFWVLALIGSINLFATLSLAGRFYDVPMWPRPFAMIDFVRAASSMLTLLMAIYFSGEAVWRERERRLNEIVDATPLPNWTFLLSKLAGVAGVLAMLSVGIILLEAILFQLLNGARDLELDQWIAWFVLPGLLYVLHIAILAVVVQAISPNKFVGWGIMLLYLVANTVFFSIGLDHPLINYAEVTMHLSDMNGANYGGTTGWWLRAYWSAFALILVVIGHLMWRRGTAVTLKGQWRTLPSRLRGAPLVLLSAALVVTIGMGSFLYYNMNVLNTRISGDEEERRLANYEKAYSRFIDAPQPTLTDVKLDVDLYPSRRLAEFDGAYRFVNATSRPIELLHVRMRTTMVPLEQVNVPGATLVRNDEVNHHRIYRFDRPLRPGESGTLTFHSKIEKKGFASFPSDTQAYELDAQPVRNGAYLTSIAFAPFLDMNRSGFLQGDNLRREHGLPPGLPTPTLEDRAAQSTNYVGVDRVNTDITVTTDADQQLIATGAKVSESVADGRRTARFVSPVPTLNFITIQSGRYDVKTANSDGVKLSVYHHPEHDMNIDRMLSVMDDSLDYFRKNFGPYQYRYARIIERPDFGGGANSAPGTVGYSEKVGFIMDFRDAKRLDFLGYVTAHELAHQYWFHQVMPADMEGAEVLTESLAQYSALMVMKHRDGPDRIRDFLKYELDIYLQGRRQENAEERPLARVNKQGYIHYNKGSIVMYLMQDRLGEERVNAVLRDLIDRYKFKTAPYPRASDLVDGLLSLARTPAERELILDQFYRITLYDLKAKQANVRRLPDGRYETIVTLDAAKFYADAKGNEREAAFAQPLDIGLFSERPGAPDFDQADVISIKRLPVRSGEQQVRIVTRQRPSFVGVDPYINFIDRNSNDNIIAPAEAGR